MEFIHSNSMEFIKLNFLKALGFLLLSIIINKYK